MTKPGLTRRDFLVGSAAAGSLLLAPPVPAVDNDLADTLTADTNYLKREWRPLPFDPGAFGYTFAEMETHWDTLLRGYLIPFPSPEYLRKRYARYPQLWKELRFQDEDYAMHSRNTLEVWLQFFRGDFQAARNLGYEYGGFSRVPALFAQIIYAVYLADSLKEKHALLLDAVDGITYYSSVFQPRPADDPQYKADYVLIRLGYAYALGRVAEDVSIPTALARDYIGKLMQASNDILTVYPEHPLGLALSAGIGANLIRRTKVLGGLGALGAKMVFGADGDESKTRFETSFALVPDLALTRFEYANSMLYVDNVSSIDESIRQLELAASFTPRHAIEALDIAYAKKRLAEVRDYKETGGGFAGYDRKRRKYQNQKGFNLYSVTGEPFLVSKA